MAALHSGTIQSLRAAGAVGDAVALKVSSPVRQGWRRRTLMADGARSAWPRPRRLGAAAVSYPLRSATPTLSDKQVSGDLQRMDNGKVKCQLTDGKENIAGVFTSQVARAFGEELKSESLVGAPSCCAGGWLLCCCLLGEGWPAHLSARQARTPAVGRACR